MLLWSYHISYDVPKLYLMLIYLNIETLTDPKCGSVLKVVNMIAVGQNCNDVPPQQACKVWMTFLTSSMMSMRWEIVGQSGIHTRMCLKRAYVITRFTNLQATLKYLQDLCVKLFWTILHICRFLIVWVSIHETLLRMYVAAQTEWRSCSPVHYLCSESRATQISCSCGCRAML